MTIVDGTVAAFIKNEERALYKSSLLGPKLAVVDTLTSSLQFVVSFAELIQREEALEYHPYAMQAVSLENLEM
ncbi:hypothetical protein PT974_05376 [Cladobotryum mycophilum]|uniref:Uncharacterized protein n=1 Tax=Cladobotryum mycophilum TaxID=491253 RepID=A0ABR0SJP5_9HYPO